MYQIKRTYMLDSTDKTDWINRISDWNVYTPKATKSNHCVKIILAKKVTKAKFLPFHIVTLSCFIESIKKKGYLIFLMVMNTELNEFIHNDMSLTQYWRGKNTDHIDSPDSSRLNLWRVVEGKSEEYEISVHQYFSNKFPAIDFFMLKSCLTELYFNIFDHANANGIAFSYIYYDEIDEVIHIAICDFGKGISKTMREAFPDIVNDEEALLLAIKRGVTARSNEHNAGFGLDNVISTLSDESTLRIASNEAILICRKSDAGIETKTFKLSFKLKGTLIYFDLPISSFEESEINEEYTF